MHTAGERGEGNNLVRVEYLKEDKNFIIETYSGDFKLLSSKALPVDDGFIWGGFFCGENANFVFLGKNNPDMDETVEVVRVIKYGKDWQRLGQAGLYGGYTKSRFGPGPCAARSITGCCTFTPAIKCTATISRT